MRAYDVPLAEHTGRQGVFSLPFSWYFHLGIWHLAAVPSHMAEQQGGT